MASAIGIPVLYKPNSPKLRVKLLPLVQNLFATHVLIILHLINAKHYLRCLKHFQCSIIFLPLKFFYKLEISVFLLQFSLSTKLKTLTSQK